VDFPGAETVIVLVYTDIRLYKMERLKNK